MAPLSERMRPQTLDEYIGQEKIIGKGKIINTLIETSRKSQFFPSLILWGPPGVGKTTIARIVAKELARDFFEFSAVNASAKEIQKIIPKNHTDIPAPIVFIDEIHRFNKAQQDKLLPHVEKGDIILIGATTENPSFEVIRPLLSRTRVIVLGELSMQELERVLARGIKELNIGIEPEAQNFLVSASNGDARILLNVLEIASHLTKKKSLTLSDIEMALQRKMLGFDKQGEEHYNVISAFIKSMRASQPDAAVYYLARMVEAGQDPLYIARRMVIFAAEDVGMAVPTALVVANEVFRACETIGYPECAIPLAHGAIYLSQAKKDRRVYDALRAAQADVQLHGNLPVPLEIRNAPTNLMKDLNYGKGYEMYTQKSFLPEKISSKKYFKKN